MKQLCNLANPAPVIADRDVVDTSSELAQQCRTQREDRSALFYVQMPLREQERASCAEIHSSCVAVT